MLIAKNLLKTMSLYFALFLFLIFIISKFVSILSISVLTLLNIIISKEAFYV